MTRVYLTRRSLLAAGAVGALTACTQKPSAEAARTPDDDAREAVVSDLSALLTQTQGLAGSAPAAARPVATRAANVYRTMFASLGPAPSSNASSSADIPTLASCLTLGQRTTATALTQVPLASGPMARLCACVAAGVMVQAQALAASVKQGAPRAPRATALPMLDNDDILVRIGRTPLILPEPPGAEAVAAMKAFSVALRTAEYGYSLVAVHTSGTDRAYAMNRAGVHRRAALALDTLGVKVAAPMPAAQLSYPVNPPNSPAAARALGRKLELATAFAASRVMSDFSTAMPLGRSLCADYLVACALAGSRWGVVPSLPGLSQP